MFHCLLSQLFVKFMYKEYSCVMFLWDEGDDADQPTGSTANDILSYLHFPRRDKLLLTCLNQLGCVKRKTHAGSEHAICLTIWQLVQNATAAVQVIGSRRSSRNWYDGLLLTRMHVGTELVCQGGREGRPSGHSRSVPLCIYCLTAWLDDGSMQIDSLVWSIVMQR